jgi:predicted exporter
LPGRNDRLLALLWLALCLLLAAALAFLLPRSQLNSSVLALLPQQNLGAAAGLYAATGSPDGVAGFTR